MTRNVAKIGTSMEAVAFANLSRQREALQERKFDLEMKKLGCQGNAAMVALIDKRIQQISQSILEYDRNINSNGGSASTDTKYDGRVV